MMLSGCLQTRRQRRRRLYRQLINEALTSISAVVERDAQVESIEALLTLSEEETVYVELSLMIVDVLKDNQPLAAVLICVLLEMFALPSIETTLRLNDLLVQRVHGRHAQSYLKRNVAVIWASLAAKLAGRHSIRLMTEKVVQCLEAFVKNRHHPSVQLHALVAVEKFSITNENKNRMMQSSIVQSLQSLEKQPLGEPSSSNSYYDRVQVAFLARWFLENTFPTEGRDFASTSAIQGNVNVILSHVDKTDFLKVSPQGLDARNDSSTFESVRATGGITTGSWFYEVTICTDGVLQIGWASKHCTFDSESGNGVGDDVNSISYDGCRRRVWHCGSSEEYGGRRWQTGDVVGVMIDVEENVLIFSLNGKTLGDALKQITDAPNLRELVQSGEKLYPAASFMAYQHCTFNFGATPFKHPPTPRFKALNNSGKLTSQERSSYVPRLQRKQPPPLDDTIPKCTICYDLPPDTILLPCKHKGFCFKCALICELCPICRTKIDSRENSPPTPQHATASESAAAAAEQSI